MRVIVLKLRVIAISHRLQGSTVELLPVTPDASPENRKFWEATPAGELTLHYAPGAEIPFTLGEYYTCSLTRRPDETEGRSWRLWKVEQQEGQLDVHFGLSWHTQLSPAHATLHLAIHNKDAWAAFVGEVNTGWELSVAHTPIEGVLPSYP
jgi:hypothetical protein